MDTQEDKELALAAVQATGAAFSHLSPALQADVDIAEAALRQNGSLQV